MQVTVVDFAKDRVIYNMTGCTKEELDNKLKVNHSLTHKQSVIVKNEGELFSVMLHKDSTGMSGGLIGMNQVKKEFARLSEAFKAYFK